MFWGPYDTAASITPIQTSQGLLIESKERQIRRYFLNYNVLHNTLAANKTQNCINRKHDSNGSRVSDPTGQKIAM